MQLAQTQTPPLTGRFSAIAGVLRLTGSGEGFLAGRKRVLGTARLSRFTTMVRAASGWLSARPSEIFLAGRKDVLGTAPFSLFRTVARAAPGWLSARAPGFLLAGREETHGTAFPFVDYSPTARTAPGWLSAARSDIFMSTAPVADGDYHLPVFPAEIAEWMAAGPEKFIIDGTLGGGGHSELFLKSGARVLGIDRDPEALAHAQRRLAGFGNRFSTWEGNYSQVCETPEIQNGDLADGILLDLGVSSRQLDSAERGFSFQREGPLDMRMGPSSPRTAADVVNGWPEADLVKILFEFGEESRARKIAGEIVKRRATKPFKTTLDLADFIEKTIGRHGRTHPATKTFQAIRMAVNEELESLAAALNAVPSALKPGGKLLIITFHSLEDRMVKRFLRHRSNAFLDDPGWPEPRPNPDYQFRLLSRKAIAPTPEETSLNPRARSAKLRVAQLLAPTS